MDDLNSMKRRMSGTSATSTLYERRRSLLTQPSPVQDTGFSASRSPAVRPAPFTPILHPLRNDTDTAHSALLSPATNGGDPLLDLTPDDEHRPFLLHTTLADLLPTRISLSLPRRISPRLLLVIFCSAAFLLLLALLSTAPLSLTSLSLLSPTARFQSKLHHAAQSYRDLHLRKRLDLIARDKIVRAEERVTPQDGGKGGKRFEQVVKRNAFPYLTLTDKEVEEVKKARAGVLWGPSDMKLGELVMDRKASYPHEFTTIFLHGLAQHVPEDAFIPNALWYKYPSTRWVSLQAPDRELSLLAIGIDATVYVPGWFNMKTRPYDALNDRDDEAFFSSTRALNAVIAKERSLLIQRRRLAAGTGGTEQLSAKDYASYGTEEEKKWASRRVILLGFSQGGAISLLAGLTNQYRLGGIAVFSTFLPMRRYMSRLMYDLNRTSTPIYWAHGTADPYLSYADALTCISLLSPSALPPLDSSSVGPSNFALTHPAYQLGMKDVQFSPQEGLIHLPSVQEIEEVDEWLKRVMAMASSQA